jgi:hypothetical protein
MHILFNLLRTKCLYMFRALLGHPQKALHKRHFIYCVRVMSVGCSWMQPIDITRRNIPSAACEAPPKDEQVMLETCTGP